MQHKYMPMTNRTTTQKTVRKSSSEVSRWREKTRKQYLKMNNMLEEIIKKHKDKFKLDC